MYLFCKRSFLRKYPDSLSINGWLRWIPSFSLSLRTSAYTVDTLFNFKLNFANFLLSGRFWNSIKTSVVERFVLFQHAVDSMEQFTHDSTNAL